MASASSKCGLASSARSYSKYNAGGQRVRKVWEHSGLVEERIYPMKMPRHPLSTPTSSTRSACGC